MDITSLDLLDRRLFLLLNGSESDWWDGFMWTVTQTQTWIPLLLVLLYVVLRTGGWRQLLCFSLALALAILLADQLSSSLLKPLFHRPRPTHAPALHGLVDTVRGYTGGPYGFVSSHAANTFAVFLLCALTVRSRLLTLTLFLWASVDSYSRVYLGVHYPGDILCGALLGLVCGLVCYLLYWLVYERRSKTIQFRTAAYTPSGFLVSDVHLLMLVLSLTLLYVCLRAILFACGM